MCSKTYTLVSKYEEHFEQKKSVTFKLESHLEP